MEKYLATSNIIDWQNPEIFQLAEKLSDTKLIGTFPMGKTLQIHVIYPETEKQTKTFVLVFAQASLIVIQLLKKLLLRGIEDIVKQDNQAVESLYPRQKAKVKLPNEEIMFYAEKLYDNWST